MQLSIDVSHEMMKEKLMIPEQRFFFKKKKGKHHLNVKSRNKNVDNLKDLIVSQTNCTYGYLVSR